MFHFVDHRWDTDGFYGTFERINQHMPSGDVFSEETKYLKDCTPLNNIYVIIFFYTREHLHILCATKNALI
jgi:hypothetical protein